MPEIENELTFAMKSDRLRMITSTNGDKVIIEGIHLDNGEAATLAWLVNQPGGTVLTLQLKIQE